MMSLKGAHFLTAFLMGVLLPVFLGAAELPTYHKYEGPIKPGVVITKANWDTYLPELEKLLPPSLSKWYGMGVREGLVTMPIVENTFPLVITKGQLEATKKYAGTARVGADNQLLDWVAGIPFPEPKTAVEIAWNCYPQNSRVSAHDDYVQYAWFGLFNGTKYQKHFSWNVYARKYRGRTDIPPLGDMPAFAEKGICYKDSIIIHEPNDVKGFIQLRIRYWDLNKPDECYAYIPALRRVRRMTGSDLTDPLLGSDCTPDDFEVWKQKFDARMTFRVLEHRDFLIPRIYVGLENKPAYDYKKHGPCYQAEWEIKSHWVLEIMTNNPDYAYSKRVIYIDATPTDHGGTFFPYVGEMFDQRGRLWKTVFMFNGVTKEGYRSMYFAGYSNYRTGHYTVLNSYTAYDKLELFRKNYPLDENKVFSVKGLLKRAH